jgi:hypothetical protein
LNILPRINFCAGLAVLCSEIRHCAKRQNVSGKASIFMNLPVAPFYVMPPDKAAAIKILLYR